MFRKYHWLNFLPFLCYGAIVWILHTLSLLKWLTLKGEFVPNSSPLRPCNDNRFTASLSLSIPNANTTHLSCIYLGNAGPLIHTVKVSRYDSSSSLGVRMPKTFLLSRQDPLQDDILRPLDGDTPTSLPPFLLIVSTHSVFVDAFLRRLTAIFSSNHRDLDSTSPCTSFMFFASPVYLALPVPVDSPISCWRFHDDLQSSLSHLARDLASSCP